MRSQEAPEHIKADLPGSAWIVELLASGSRYGKPFQAKHLIHHQPAHNPRSPAATDPGALEHRKLALDPRHAAPRALAPLPRYRRWHIGYDANHRP